MAYDFTWLRRLVKERTGRDLSEDALRGISSGMGYHAETFHGNSDVRVRAILKYARTYAAQNDEPRWDAQPPGDDPDTWHDTAIAALDAQPDRSIDKVLAPVAEDVKLAHTEAKKRAPRKPRSTAARKKASE